MPAGDAHVKSLILLMFFEFLEPAFPFFISLSVLPRISWRLVGLIEREEIERAFLLFDPNDLKLCFDEGGAYKPITVNLNFGPKGDCFLFQSALFKKKWP